MRTLTPAGPIPARFALATSSASALTSVIHTAVPFGGSSWASDSPIAPDPVPRSATTRVGPTADAFSIATPATSSVSGRGISTRRSTARVIATETPLPEHVLQRLAAAEPGEHRVEVRHHPNRRGFVEPAEELVTVDGAGGHFAQPPRLRPIADGRGRLGPQLAPADRPAGHLAAGRLAAGHLAQSPSARSRRPLLGGQRVDDHLEVAGEDRRQPVDREADAVIGDTVLLVVVRADLLAASATAHLRPTLGGQLLGAFTFGEFEQPGPQDEHRPSLVLELRPFVLHRDHDPGRSVGDADGGVGGVDALAAGPAGPEDVDVEVPVVDLHVDLVDLGQDGHRRGRRVDAALALGDRHALHAVRTTFELEVAPRRGAARPRT